MLTSPPPPPPSRADVGTRMSPVQRLHSSLKQEYQEFILQRIEEYKDNLPREQLLQLGDEAVRELQANAEGQYLLTEVLLLEHVDRIIARRLRLPAFARWRQKYRALREAQRQPTHWGLEADNPVARWTPRLEPGDLVVVVGASAFPCALFVAAHDFQVLLLDQDLGAIEAVEGRAVSEQLAGRFQALVVQFGGWLPDVQPSLVVIEPTALGSVRSRDRRALIGELQTRTRNGGVHVVLSPPRNEGTEVIPLAPEALQAEYAGWQIEPPAGRKRGGGGTKRGGFIAQRPPRHSDTRANVSE